MLRRLLEDLFKPKQGSDARQSDITQKQRFRNAVEFARQVCDIYEKEVICLSNHLPTLANEVTRHPIIDVIRLLGLSIQTKFLSQMLYQKEDSLDSLDSDTLLLKETTIISTENKLLLFQDIKQQVFMERHLNLGSDLVLPWPWRRSRLVNCLATIGSGRVNGEWKQDDNHYVELWLPMGIAWVHGGNHSIATGIIQAQGFIIPKYIYDVSRVYDYVVCDGENYLMKGNRSKIQPVGDVEFAAIFEIGRIMTERSISF